MFLIFQGKYYYTSTLVLPFPRYLLPLVKVEKNMSNYLFGWEEFLVWFTGVLF